MVNFVHDTTRKELKQIKKKAEGKYINSLYSIKEPLDFDIDALS